MAICVIIISVLVALSTRILKVLPLLSWFLGFMVVPIAVLIFEFALPYSGDGASMWPITLIVGGAYGALSSLIGVLFSTLYIKYLNRLSDKNNDGFL